MGPRGDTWHPPHVVKPSGLPGAAWTAAPPPWPGWGTASRQGWAEACQRELMQTLSPAQSLLLQDVPEVGAGAGGLRAPCSVRSAF